ncbi:MAG: GWxTD domain-containing protein, partial [Melioribacteraceae bacterium]|nr:GWxTD domain-containing protein [Melioribacteraceae bacterium]
KIVATKNESEQYSDLDSLNAKREFLYLFWKKRDNIPATEVNEFKRAYFSRVTMAEQRYSALSNPGYRTDRGIVYIKFGEPDEIDRHPNETETKPYEVWYYNQIEGGVVFVFADLTGFNNYELLHSTKRGELQDPRWRRRIETN